MSGPADAFSIVIDAHANLASWLHPWPEELAADAGEESADDPR
jgi:hypothetical protein